MSEKHKILTLIILAVGALLAGISLGGAAIPLTDIFAVFGNHLFGIPLPQGFESIHDGLIWSIRLPRVLLAFIVGAALSASGTIMQSVLKNPLASSYTIGVSSGAGLGAVIVIVTGVSSSFLGFFLLPAVAMSLGMLTVICAIYLASKIDHNLDNYSIILIGTVISIFANAVMMTLASKSPAHSQQITLWQMGSFAMKDWWSVGIVFVISMAVIFGLLRYTKEMDILTFGDEQASAIGINVKKTKWLLILLSAILAGVSVAFVGVIGFVDLIAPHIVRRFFGSSHKYVLPLSCLFGGLFMILADLVARTAFIPSEIPVGSVTALIGAPFFVYVFLAKRKEKKGGALL